MESYISSMSMSMNKLNEKKHHRTQYKHTNTDVATAFHYKMNGDETIQTQ